MDSNSLSCRDASFRRFFKAPTTKLSSPCTQAWTRGFSMIGLTVMSLKIMS